MKMNNCLQSPELEAEGSTAAPIPKIRPIADVDDLIGDVPNENADDFSSIASELLGEEDDDDFVIPDEPVEQILPTAKAPEPVVQPPVQEQQVPVATPEASTAPAPVTEPAPIAQPLQPTQPEVPAAPVLSYDEQRAAAKAQVMESITFTEDEVDQLQTEPEVVLRSKLADLYINAHEAILQRVYMELPTMVQRMQTQEVASRKAEQDFYASWPSLKSNDQAHVDVIHRIGKVYRQMYPQATAEEFTRDVGAQAMIALKMPLPLEMQRQDPPSAPNIAPHQPLRAPSAMPAQQKSSDNPFEALADEILADDNS